MKLVHGITIIKSFATTSYETTIDESLVTNIALVLPHATFVTSTHIKSCLPYIVNRLSQNFSSKIA